LYPGIDAYYHGRGDGLEFNLVLRPFADPKLVRFRLVGDGTVRMNRSGDLSLAASGVSLQVQTPSIYQQTAAGRDTIPGRYVLGRGGVVRLRLGRYNPARPLVIDPTEYVLQYGTYISGAPPTCCDESQSNAIAVDSSGDAYVTGETMSGNFPTCPGSSRPAGSDECVSTTGTPLQTSETISGSENAVFVAKLNPSGTQLEYSTYLGGAASNPMANGGVATGYGIAVDGADHAYITGAAPSNLPLCPGSNSTLGADACVSTSTPLQTSAGGTFVAELSADGSRLEYSTYLGQNTTGYGIAVGIACTLDSCPAYVTGDTTTGGIPTCPGPSATPGSDACASNGTPLQSVPISGPSSDLYTAFVSELNAGGTSLIYSTYLGAVTNNAQPDGEPGRGVAVDSLGDAYVTGITDGNFPTCPGSNSTLGADACVSTGTPLQSSLTGPADAYVAEINPAGTQLVYSTYLGTSGALGVGIAVNASAAACSGLGCPAYVLGGNGSEPSVSIPLCPGPNYNAPAGSDKCTSNGTALQTSASNDFAAELNTGGTELVYSTYLPNSNGFENYGGIAVDTSGDAYVAADISRPNLNTCPGSTRAAGSDPCSSTTGTPLQTAYAGSRGTSDGFVAELAPSGTQLIHDTYLGGAAGAVPYGISLDTSGDAYVTGSTASPFPTCPGASATPGADACASNGTPLQSSTSPTNGTAFVAEIGVLPPAVCPAIRFTYNGRPIGKPIIGPCGANDFDISWRAVRCQNGIEYPQVSPIFTYQGQYVASNPQSIPCTYVGSTNDIEIFWTPHGSTNVISRACWTHNGTCVDPISVPNGGLVDSPAGGTIAAPYVDDVCFEMARGSAGITRAEWTRDGRPYGNINVPFKPHRANDVCWYGYGAGS
jgi:hypothetical protein